MLARLIWGCAIASSLAITGCSLERVGVAGGDGGGGGIDAAVRDAGDGDAARRCNLGECDDGNPCTSDVCNPSIGCVSTPVEGACDDGVLCNGADSCEGGTCSVHDGEDPCPGSSFCDVASDSCMGCVEDADCPGETAGDWGACTFPASDVCATAGTRTRTVRRYSCAPSGVCEPSDRTETDGCTRVTDGSGCGTTTMGPWSACTYADATCSTTGTRTRTVTMPFCMGGTCQSPPMTVTDTTGCARTTDGTTCGALAPGPWGECGGYSDTCDQTGTQSRMITPLRCGTGTCSVPGTPATEMRDCMRDTGGTACGAPESCEEYGLCVRTAASDAVCSGSGTQTRRCTSTVCGAGTCATPSVRLESQPCTLGTGPCERTRMCGACQPLRGTTCTSGAAGYRTCTIATGSCSGGMTPMCGGNSGDVTVYVSCTCP